MDYNEEYPCYIRFEVDIANPITFFEMMDRAEKTGIKVVLTAIPTSGFNLGYTYDMHVELKGRDEASLAAFVQMLHEDELMTVNETSRANMQDVIDRVVDETVGVIEWL